MEKQEQACQDLLLLRPTNVQVSLAEQRTQTFYKHPEECCEVEISESDEGEAPGELDWGQVEALQHRRDNPAGVGEGEGEEKIGMDFVTQTAHLSAVEIFVGEKFCTYRVNVKNILTSLVGSVILCVFESITDGLPVKNTNQNISTILHWHPISNTFIYIIQTK